MGQSVTAESRPVMSSDRMSRPRMAKAEIRKTDQDTWRSDIGQAVRVMRMGRGLTLKEFAAQVERDERTCSRWETGEERPQLDAIFAVQAFRLPMVLALAKAAEEAGDAIVTETLIRVRA